MQPFETVRERLLRAGIAASAVNRYVVELREHLADLTARERAAGLDAGEAASRARTLMGTEAQLAQAMIDRGAPRALSVKAPWAVFALLPVVGIVAVIWLIAMAMMRILMPVHAALPGGYRALIAAAGFFASYAIGPLAAAACIAVALRQRLTSGWVWTGLALIALLSGFFGFYPPSAPGMPYHAATLAYANGHVSAAATLALVGLRAAVLFVLAALAWRALRARQALPA